MKTITLTKVGISAYYGDPDRRLRITLPEDWGVWHCSKPGVGVVAVLPVGIPLPNVIADAHGGYWVAEWMAIHSDRKIGGWTRVIAPAQMGGDTLPPEKEGPYAWYDVVRSQSIDSQNEKNLAYRRRVYPVWVEEEVDSVTGPLAPSGAETQNIIASLILGGSPSD